MSSYDCYFGNHTHHNNLQVHKLLPFTSTLISLTHDEHFTIIDHSEHKITTPQSLDHQEVTPIFTNQQQNMSLAPKQIYAPRVLPAVDNQAVYNQAKAKVMSLLSQMFYRSLVEYGAIRVLIWYPSTTGTFPWEHYVELIKGGLEADYGRHDDDHMWFAIRSGRKTSIEIDVKMCMTSEMFELDRFQLNYASLRKLIGSMIEPLGLSIDTEGLHICIEENEELEIPSARVFVSEDPEDVLKIVRLDRRILDGGFKSRDEIYEYLASSWLFNPGHFANARPAEEAEAASLPEKAVADWTRVVIEWLPQYYPGSHKPFVQDLHHWYACTRKQVQRCVFAMFPSVPITYYKWNDPDGKLENLGEILVEMLAQAIPSGTNGAWMDDFPYPRLLHGHVEPGPQLPLQGPLPLICVSADPTSQPQTPEDDDPTSQPQTPEDDVPPLLDSLPRDPPDPYILYQPAAEILPKNKVLCLACWTVVDEETGTLSLRTEPCYDEVEMRWIDAIYSGATGTDLIDWARDMWWRVWVRQTRWHYVQHWRSIMEEEDKKKAEEDRKRQEEEDRKKKEEDRKKKEEDRNKKEEDKKKAEEDRKKEEEAREQEEYRKAAQLVLGI
ncbi:hypothetical protein GMOD_00005850 [Pyrenophora seminiperda CCB06]|uniref:Uncharacterized protein n=1 Tax=Pyrenophora seminiperda CCB06 TaxID=1302712 RepID=A0A3M7M9W4_9PLEO|nr:hypothetical protein GMOD_00005850 [Pyrenophora seminiperda CCB06]